MSIVRIGMPGSIARTGPLVAGASMVFRLGGVKVGASFAVVAELTKFVRRRLKILFG